MPLPFASEHVGRELVGRYRIERLIGQGGMGVLYAGHHLLTERPVAIKFLRPRGDPHGIDVDRFMREARVAARLEHPNVVEVLDMGLDADAPYLVMELLRGESLAEELEREGHLTPEQAFARLAPIMGALAAAHDAGVVHRDLKPENIFLARYPDRPLQPKLLDFGVAKETGEVSLTHSGVTVGTPTYMSPEQAKGEVALGPASDVWSMGVVWFRTLAGCLPHEGSSPTGILIRIVTEPARKLSSVRPELPAPLAAVIDQALERRLERRHPDMRSFARALVAAARQHGIAVPSARDVPGLPGWEQWLTHVDDATVSLPATTAVVDLVTESPSIPAPRPSSGRLVSLALVALAVIVGLSIAVWVTTHSTTPSEDVPSASPSPLRTAPSRADVPAPGPVAPKPNELRSATPLLARPDTANATAEDVSHEPESRDALDVRELGDEGSRPTSAPTPPTTERAGRAPRERVPPRPRGAPVPKAARAYDPALL